MKFAGKAQGAGPPALGHTPTDISLTLRVSERDFHTGLELPRVPDFLLVRSE